jgi:hypothetical protein
MLHTGMSSWSMYCSNFTDSSSTQVYNTSSKLKTSSYYSVVCIQGRYARTYLQIIILKNLHAPRARGARARARAAREGRRDESTVNNSGSKLKIRLTGELENLMARLSWLFLGYGDNFWKGYDVQQIWTKTRDLVAYPPCKHWAFV